MQSQSSLEEQHPVLVSATDSSLNVASNISRSATSRKRKSCDINGSDTEVFTATLLPSRNAISFVSITVVARACLPLAWLNSSTSTSSVVFQAEIPSVEEWQQRVLIVRRVPNGGLYAVEQVASDTYVACALHDWVAEAWCYDAAIGRIAEVRVEDLLAVEDDAFQRGHSRTSSRSESVSNSTALHTPRSPKRPKNRRGALARMSILAPKEAAAGPNMMDAAGPPIISRQPLMELFGKDIGPETGPSNLPKQPAIAQSLVQEPLPLAPDAQISSQNPFDLAVPTQSSLVLEVEPVSIPEPGPMIPALDPNPLATERLRNQYFEHLYTSKTSLAFYVKGPLSRARAHVRTADDAAKAIKELSDFYEQSMLPTKKVDLKYKESVAKVIKEFPLPHSEEGAPNAAELKKKKSRKKKMKLDKDCLWPEEEDFVAKWWRGRDLHGTIAASDQAEEMRKELSDLRMRETKMQLLLILEVMLLASAATKLAESEKPAAAADPNVKIETIEEDAAAAILVTTPHKQPKEKKRDWPAEIETIVDRLCIWHTVSLGDLGSTADDKSSKNDGNGSTASKPNDLLRDFCKDVLLPFYSAKLPVQIKAVCRKLGGPERSPTRAKQTRPLLHKSSSSISSLSKAKPGQPLSKRTLECVLSEDHQLLRHASPPATFSRAPSMSAPIIPTLKREPSERPASRGGMLSKSVSFSNREIDLVADQKVHDAKRRKVDRLAKQKKELEAAIDALKKPDRRTVASQIMDEAEERKRLELEKKMAVQISATPRTKRFQGQSQLMDEPQLPPMPMLRLVAREQEAATVIPSSTMKPRPMFGMSSSTSKPRSSAAKRAVLAAIHETPSRGFEKKTSNPMKLPAPNPTSVETAEVMAVAATPASNRADLGTEYLPSSGPSMPTSQPPPSSSQLTDAGAGLLMKRSRRQVLFTPMKKSEARLDEVFRDAPVIPEHAGHMMDRVMGGKGRGMDDDFKSLRSDLLTKPKATYSTEQKVASSSRADVDDSDIYDKLGWNEFDF